MARRTFNMVGALAGVLGAAALANCSSNGDTDHHAASVSSGAGASRTVSSTTAGSGSSSSGAGGAGGAPSTFQKDPPEVYVAKVKNLLIGKPPTDMEIYQVVSDKAPPAALQSLIKTWMADPAYDLKMRVFFELAFQQTQLTATSYGDMFNGNNLGPGPLMPLLVQNTAESFARTMTALIDQKQPFTESLTTTTYMMTPPLMSLYGLLDEWQVNDETGTADNLIKDYPGTPQMLQGTKDTAGNSLQFVTAAESLDPTSPHFLQFYNAQVPNLPPSTTQTYCNGIDPIVYPTSTLTLHNILYGATYFHLPVGAAAGTPSCGGTLLSGASYWAASDFAESAWRMVTVRPPNPGEQTTRFFDVASLRNANELVINTERLGFFSTPAFFANWSTNSSNQMRVTLNQALIVALGAAVDGTDVTPVPNAQQDGGPPGLDPEHDTAACFTCHQYLDPMRVVLSTAWTYSYHDQLSATQIANRGQFVFQGQVNTNINSVQDFARELATHPLQPSAWVQKLCYYANSQACEPTDPEFKRLVGVFGNSQLDWPTLIVEFFSSPITTNAAPTQTTLASEVVAVSRRDHLCAALNNRLQLVDICGLDATSGTSLISTIVAGLPSDGYGRGSIIPVLPTAPTLFYRSGLENICQTIAAMVIDPAAPPVNSPNALSWSSKTPASVTSAISDFTSILMGIESSDGRSAPIQAALQAHYTSALADKIDGGPTITTTEALQSTFMVACLSPSVAGIGM